MTDTKLCPFCGEEIKAIAIKCKHCGERLDPSQPSSDATPPGSSSGVTPPTVLAGAAVGEASPGAKLGAYVLGAALGTGGMGSVYQAQHERLGNPVAIKILASNLAGDADLIARFEQEARLQANLRHPNVVAVTDFLIDGGFCAFVMELVEGETLADIIAEHQGPFALERCRQVLVPVLDALAFAHAQGIVHRDIKPSNIMVATAGEAEVIKVMDFGIAKALGAAKRTATGSMMGTLHYMSPEQCQDSKGVDARSDLYSVGVMLFEMATGRLPFEYESGYAMMTAHIAEPPPRPSRFSPAVFPAFEQLILKSLAKDAAARHQSAGELKAELVGLSDGADAPAPSPAPPDEVGRAVESRPEPGAQPPTMQEIRPPSSGPFPPADSSSPPVQRTQLAPPATPGGPARSRLGMYIAIGAVAVVVLLGGSLAALALAFGVFDEAESDDTLEIAVTPGMGAASGIDGSPGVADEGVANEVESLPRATRISSNAVCPGVAGVDRDRLVAQVDDVGITVCHVSEALNKMSPYLRKAYESPEKRRQFVDNMIRFELIAQEAERRGYASDPEVERVREQMLVQRLNKEIQDGVRLSDITEEEMRAYYQEHEGDYHKGEMVRIARILVGSRSEAQRVLALARTKANDSRYFRELAREHTIDAETREHGGDLPYFPRLEDRTDDDPDIDPALVRAAFTLDMRRPLYRSPIKTDEGWNVIRLRGRRRGRDLPYEDVKRQIRHRLHRDRLSQARDELVAKLRQSADIQIFESALASARVDTSGGATGETGSSSSPRERSRPVATIKASGSTTKITVGDFEDRVNKLGPFERVQYGSLEKRGEFLDQMIDWKLQARYAQSQGSGDDVAIPDQLKRVMATLMMRRDVDDRIRPEDVTDEELRAYYDEHLTTFRRPERVRAYHIVLSDRGKAQGLLRRIIAENVDTREFRRLAREMSEDPITKRRGGDLRYFTRPEDRGEDDPEVHPAIVEATFKLARQRQAPRFNPIYPKLVSTPQGYHILRFMGHREAVNRSFGDIERQIRNRVWRQKLQEAREEFIAELRLRHRVALNEDNLALVKMAPVTEEELAEARKADSGPRRLRRGSESPDAPLDSDGLEDDSPGPEDELLDF